MTICIMAGIMSLIGGLRVILSTLVMSANMLGSC
jgi:hypothetical protein